MLKFVILPTPERLTAGADDVPVAVNPIFANLTLAVHDIKVLDKVLGLMNVAVGDSPVIEIPLAVIAIGPVLLSSVKIPGYITISTGFAAVEIAFAVVIACDKLAYGVENDPSPVISDPNLVTYIKREDVGVALAPLLIQSS